MKKFKLLFFVGERAYASVEESQKVIHKDFFKKDEIPAASGYNFKLYCNWPNFCEKMAVSGQI